MESEWCVLMFMKKSLTKEKLISFKVIFILVNYLMLQETDERQEGNIFDCEILLKCCYVEGLSLGFHLMKN